MDLFPSVPYTVGARFVAQRSYILQLLSEILPLIEPFPALKGEFSVLVFDKNATSKDTAELPIFIGEKL